jgi:hypothetical protein
MKFIIFTKEQSDNIRGIYDKGFSSLEPITVYRNKYLMGVKIPLTEVEEYALPENCLVDPNLYQVRGFLQCFPIYDANYYRKEKDIETGAETLIYY